MPPCVGAQRPPDSSSDMTSPPETAFTEDAALDQDEFDTQSLPALAGWVVGQLVGELDHGHLVLLAGQFVLVRHYRSPRNWKRITPVSVGLSFLLRPEKVGALIPGRMVLNREDGLEPLG